MQGNRPKQHLKQKCKTYIIIKMKMNYLKKNVIKIQCKSTMFVLVFTKFVLRYSSYKYSKAR